MESNNRIGRRRALALAGGGLVAGSAAPWVWSRRALAQPAAKPRIVVAGGGVAGATFASNLLRLVPGAEVVMVEPQETFFSAPSSIDYVFGRIEADKATRGYGSLEKRGVRIVRGRVLGADPERRVVETEAGPLSYTTLVLATGIELAAGEIEGLADDPGSNLSLYDRPSLAALRQRIAAFEGGTIVVSVPPGALKCPPAPYEYAMTLAESIRSRGVKGEVVLIDAWPTPQPDALGEALSAAMAEYDGILDYIGQDEVAGVDLGGKKVLTAGGDEIPYDLLSLIPRNRASSLAAKMGIAAAGDEFAEVDPVTMRSARYPDVFAIGDLARTPYGNNAASAAGAAILCAREVARDLGARLPAIDAANPARVGTACYPYVAPGRALRLAVEFSAHVAGGQLALASKVDVDGAGGPDNVLRRQEWEAGLLGGMFA